MEGRDFESVKARLDEIVEEIAQDGVSLDEALALYEEAVKLGLAACDVSEADILPPEPEAEPALEAQSDELDPAAEASMEAVPADSLVPDESSEDALER